MSSNTDFQYLFHSEPIIKESALKMKRKLKHIALNNETYQEDYIADYRSVIDFLEHNQLQNIVRASKSFTPDGVKLFHSKRMISLYSAPHITSPAAGMTDDEDAKGAILRFEDPTSMDYHIIPFLTRLNDE